jgi:glycosyltransferase involved in cell wall biosynthesis
MLLPYDQKIPASVIVLSQDEEINIKDCLESLTKFFDDIWLIDSQSKDRTIEIAKKFNVNILQNQFIDYANQRNWGLDNANLKYDWVIYIDADEQVNHEFCNELKHKIITSSEQIGGMSITVNFIFYGRPIRFARPAVPMLRVFRRGKARWEKKGSREYGVVMGDIITLKTRIIHHNKKPLSDWLIKQIKNANMEVLQKKSFCNNKVNYNTTTVTYERAWRFWLRANVWDNLPRFWRVFIYFFYRYIPCGGILDGKAGFAYCFLHAFWYPFLIDMMLDEPSNEKKNYYRG